MVPHLAHAQIQGSIGGMGDFPAPILEAQAGCPGGS